MLADAAQHMDCAPYVHGGLLRDKILGLRPNDIDVIFTQVDKPTGESLREKLAAACNMQIKRRGNPSLGYWLEADGVVVDCASTELDIVSYSRLSDFTVSSLALDLQTMSVIDSVPCAMEDIHARLIRPTEPGQLNAVRILRLAALAAKMECAVPDSTLETAVENRPLLCGVQRDFVIRKLQEIGDNPHGWLVLEQLELHKFSPAVAQWMLQRHVDLRQRVFNLMNMGD